MGYDSSNISLVSRFRATLQSLLLLYTDACFAPLLLCSSGDAGGAGVVIAQKQERTAGAAEVVRDERIVGQDLPVRDIWVHPLHGSRVYLGVDRSLEKNKIETDLGGHRTRYRIAVRLVESLRPRGV